MYCTNCGNPNNPNGSYCVACGTPIDGGAATLTQQRSFQTYRYEAARPSALGAAWQDITDTADWWKKVLLLCLLSCVPIVNFAVDGFALRWGRELSFKKNEPLPKMVFKKKEILTGFRALLLNLIYAIAFLAASFIATALLTAVFTSVNQRLGAAMGVVLTVLAVLAYLFAYWPMVNAAIMRMTVVDYLESGLNFKKVWHAFRKSPSGAMSATIVPSFASSLIQFLLWALCFAILAAVLQSSVNSYMDMIGSYGYSAYMDDPFNLVDEALRYVRELGGIAVALMVVTLVATEMVGMFSKILTWRAMGHWAAWAAAEWSLESDEEDAAKWAEARTAGKNPEASRQAKSIERSRSDSFGKASNWNVESAAASPNANVGNESRSSVRPSGSAKAGASDDNTIISSKQHANSISLVRISTRTRYDVTSLPAIVGKGSAADVVIEGAGSVSRTHAKVSFDKGSITLEDLESTNGTKVNGNVIPSGVPVAIQEGDIISLSDEEFRVMFSS